MSPKYFNIRYLLILGGFFLFLFGGYHLFFLFDRKQEQKQVVKDRGQARLSQKDILQISEGDIILRRGYGFFSDFIADNLNEDNYDVTHAGILYKKNNEWYVIHSLSSDVSDFDGVQEQKLEEFLVYSAPQKILVVRTKGTTAEQGKQIVEEAQKYLAKKTPFDHRGVIDNDEKLYCTELIWHIVANRLNYIQLPENYADREKLLYNMTGMYSPQYFDIIVNTYQKR